MAVPEPVSGDATAIRQGRGLTTKGAVAPGLRAAAIATTFVGAYVALDWVSYIHPIGQLAITPWNPPPALSLFLLLRYGVRFIPALFLATFLADVLVRGNPVLSPMTLIASALLASGYATVGVALRRWLHGGRSLATLHDLNGLVTAAVASPILVGIAYVGANVAAGHLPAGDFAGALLQFWIGDAIGIVVTTPFLLEFTGNRVGSRLQLDAEAILQAAAVAGALWIVFGLSATDEFKFFYLLFVPLIWIAMRRGMRGAILASLTMQVGLIAAVGNIDAKGIQLWELQLLMLTLALTALYLGMAVTERRNAQRVVQAREAALERALRMATAGELAAGIAHELNQPLSAISMYVRTCVAIDEKSPNGALGGTLEKVTREVGRAGATLRRLRQSLRTATARRERVTPGSLVETVLEAVVPRAAEYQIEVAISYEPSLPEIEVDRTQLEMALRNLLTNAIDALIEVPEPQRLIHVRVTRTGPDTVMFEITDNGPGVAAEMAGRLFEPFASTKPDGMGFGLAISRSIAEAHGGELVLIETRDRGATFQLALPIARDHG
jgi:two-component system, LuxR family, sensor kinase FixL